MDLLTRKLREKKNASIEECLQSYISAVDEEIVQAALLVLFSKIDHQAETTRFLTKQIKVIKEKKKHDFNFQIRIRMLEHLLAYNKRKK